MRNHMKSLLPLWMGALLAVGCGGPLPEESQAPRESIAIPEQYLAPEDVSAEEGTVGANMACCFIRCTDLSWRGPFPNVVYGNCINFAKYRCANLGKGYHSVDWKNC